VSSQSDIAKLAAGAAKIHKAQRELQGSKVGKRLDGTLTSVARELTRLHNKMMAAARTTLEDAIKAGELLIRVRASRKGQWLKWIETNVPFSHDTARNYIGLYERRDDLKLRTFRNLREAYALLYPPKQARARVVDPAAEQLVSKGIAKDERTARDRLRKREEEAEAMEEPKSEPDSKPELPADKTPKVWTPAVLGESDLTDEELSVVKHVREYLTSTPMERCEVFLRYIRENLECGRG